MKARMLCLLFLVSVQASGQPAQTKPKIDLHQTIEDSSAQAENLSTQVTAQVPDSTTISFYKADWLNLRQRKRRALASAEMPVRIFKTPGPSKNEISSP